MAPDSAGLSKLAQLRTMSVVVADTGDYDAVQRLRPVDCTTNPSIVRKALDLPIYADLLGQHVDKARARLAGHGAEVVARDVVDALTVGVGAKLASLIPGRVSTEVDADLSHDTAATVAKAHRFIAMYRDLGIGQERVLIKVAATWEGIRAAAQLQQQGIDCNVTLIFNHTQAIACAEAGAFLVSPFVGRILDWHLARGEKPASIEEDPGVRFVRRVYNSFKSRGVSTVVMGASFRSTAQIEALAGCDRLTIAPDLLEKLDADQGSLPRRLVAAPPAPQQFEKIDAAAFERDLAADAMASEKLRDGIAAFTKDLLALRASIAARLQLP
ncbi:MAG: transaldolase [Steroidobacteraceae bacterium]